MNPPLFAAGLLGSLAIALGAYGAHGLEGSLASLGYADEELAHRLANFLTGVRYQLHAATALLVIGLAGSSFRKRLHWPALLLTAGALLFCGLLYVLAFVGADWRWLGAIVPIGGLAMIAAWGLIAVVGFRTTGESPDKSHCTRATGSSSNSELIRLEELLTHQQQFLQELDTGLTELRQDYDARSPKLAAVEVALRRLGDLQESAEMDPDERPPHY